MADANVPAPPEVVETSDTVVACDGDGGVLGHPRVYLNMGGRGEVVCPYCDRLFKLKPGATPRGEH